MNPDNDSPLAPLHSRRSFCGAACTLLAATALSRFAQGGEAPVDPGPVKLTQETKLSLKPGDARDYRKQGGFYLLADERGIYALTTVCTHRGCTVHLDGDGTFGCPCHDSSYDHQGRVIEGPAQLPLRHFEVREAEPGGRLLVDTSKTVPPEVRL